MSTPASVGCSTSGVTSTSFSVSINFKLLVKESFLDILVFLSALHVVELETPFNGGDKFEISVFLYTPELIRGIVGGDVELRVAQGSLGPLLLSNAAILVCPDLDVVGKARTHLVEVIDQYCGFTIVGIPPLVLGFEVEGGFDLPNQVAFTHPSRTKDPNTLDVIGGQRGDEGLFAGSEGSLQVVSLESKGRVHHEDVLEGGAWLQHLSAKTTAVLSTGVDLLFPVENAELDVVSVLLDVLGDGLDGLGLLVVAVVTVEVPEVLVAAVEPVFEEDVGVDVGGAVLVKLAADHSTPDRLSSQFKLEELESLLLGQVQLWIGQEERLGVDLEL